MAYLDLKPKFTIEQFNIEFTKLVTFFRASVTREITEKYYKRLQIYPFQAFRWAVEDRIDNNRPTSSNFPTLQDMLNACSVYLQNHQGLKHQSMVYDHPTDYTFPIEKLKQGFNILINRCTADNIQPFVEFADKERMPVSDRQAVIDKWKYIKDIDGMNGWVKNQKAIIVQFTENFGNIDGVPF